MIGLNCQIWNKFVRISHTGFKKGTVSPKEVAKVGFTYEWAKYDAEWAEYVAKWAESEFDGNSFSFRLGLVGGLLISM